MENPADETRARLDPIPLTSLGVSINDMSYLVQKPAIDRHDATGTDR